MHSTLLATLRGRAHFVERETEALRGNLKALGHTVPEGVLRVPLPQPQGTLPFSPAPGQEEP